MDAHIDQPDQPHGFFERVLEHVPTAHIVVSAAGVIKYGNEQMRRLTGWSTAELHGKSVFDSIHPDDVEWIAQSFLKLASNEQAGASDLDRPWEPINFRLLDRSGAINQVEVTGRGMLEDPLIDGIVYEIRPAREREIFQRVLHGFAAGGPLESQFDLILQSVSASALAIDAAIVRFGADERCNVITAVDPELARLLSDAASENGLDAFRSPAITPQFQSVADLVGSLGSGLSARGYHDAWHIDVPDLDGGAPADRYRIVAFTKVHHDPARGVIERIVRGAELAAVISVRSRSERRLDEAAHHDHLTGLPNRLGLQRHVTDLFRTHGSETARGATLLFVDLDGFKAVNDRYGHAIGDLVLRGVGTRLRSVTRGDGLVARFGGDEFAVVLDTVDPDRVATYAYRVGQAFGRPIVVEAISVEVSASIGTAMLATPADLGTAIAQADEVMYEAKRSGGGWSSGDSEPPPDIR